MATIYRVFLIFVGCCNCNGFFGVYIVLPATNRFADVMVVTELGINLNLFNFVTCTICFCSFNKL